MMNYTPMTSLQYRDEEDKAFGLAGMIYSLGAVDGLDSVAEVSLDTDGPMVTFRHGYFFNGSPAVSPKSTWDNMLRNFHLTSVMVLSNLMSRTIVKDAEEPDSKLLQEIRDLFEEEGERECSLEKDELDALYDRILHYTMRLFKYMTKI